MPFWHSSSFSSNTCSISGWYGCSTIHATASTIFSACREGLGLAWLPRYAADADASLRLLSVPEPPGGRDVWLGVHRDLRDTPRIREVLGLLTAALTEQAKQMSAESGAALPIADAIAASAGKINRPSN